MDVLAKMVRARSMVPVNKPSGAERAKNLAIVNSPRFVDLPPNWIDSRYLVGAHVHAHESAVLATEIMRGLVAIHGVAHVMRADRGTSTTCKTIGSDLLAPSPSPRR